MADIPLIVTADTSTVVKGKADLAGFKEALGGVKKETEAVTGASQRGTGAAKGYTESQRQGTTAAKESTRAAHDQAASIDRVAQAYKLARGAIAGFIGMAIVRDLQNTTMTLQKIDMTFQAVTGSAAEARTEMDYVRGAADSLGQDVLTAAGAYAKLLAATKGTNITLQESRTVFEGITAAATAYGLSQYELEGALMAVQQMISKGSVQAEELRGQLGERLPGAFQIAARSMGMSTQQLSKALEQGQVAADDFVRAFGSQLQLEFGGFAQTAQTAGRAVNELENSMLALKESIISGGFKDAFFTILNALNQIAQTKGVEAAARAIGAAFRVIADAAALVLGYIEKIADSAVVEAAFNIMSAALSVLGDNLGVVVNILVIFASLVAGDGIISGILAIIETVKTFGGVVATVTALTAELGISLTVLSGPVGWIIGLMALATAAYVLFADKTKSVEEATRDMTRAMSDVESSVSGLESIQKRLADGYVAMGTAAAQGSLAQEAAAALNVDATQREIDKQNQLIETQRAVLEGKIAALDAANKQARSDLGVESYTGAVASLQDDEAAGDITGVERLEEIRRIQKMSNDELMEYRRQALLDEVAMGEVLSEREQQYLAQVTAILEGEQASLQMKDANEQLGITLAKNAEEFEKTIAAAKQLGDIKEGVAPLLTSIQAMGSSLQLAAKDSIALDVAIKQVFAAKTPQAMADAIGEVRTILARTEGDTSVLDKALDGVLTTLGQMAGVNISAPIWDAVGAAGALETAMKNASAAYSAKRDATGQSGPDSARSETQFGQVKIDGEILTPGVFGAGGPAVKTGSVGGSGGGGGGGGGGSAPKDAYAEEQANIVERMAKAQADLNNLWTGEDPEKYAAIQAAITSATGEGVTLTEEQTAAITEQATAVFELEKEVASLKDAYDAIEQAAEGFGSAMGKALGDAAFGVGNFRDAATAAFKDLVSTILQELGKLAASKILQMILGATFGGGGGGGFGGFNFGGGGIPAMAEGGIVRRPTLALVGEAGPEAVVPLSRGPEFGLGGSSKSPVTVNVTNNVPGAQVDVQQKGDGTIEVLIAAAQRSVADGVARGTGELSRVLEGTYGLRRLGR